MTQSLNINQFKQVPVRGELDLQISRDGVLTGQISSNQSDPVYPGDAVKLDSGSTSNIPQFLKAGVNDTAIGFISFDVKKSTLEAGDAVEVAFDGGPVMWMLAGDTVDSGEAVESNTDGEVVPLVSASQRGIALDPGTEGNLLRVIIKPEAA